MSKSKVFFAVSILPVALVPGLAWGPAATPVPAPDPLLLIALGGTMLGLLKYRKR
jgi:hypothetical protein